jgi:glyoxylase-like metal-dependent hydrolase (beta-lactamase superfamily II)
MLTARRARLRAASGPSCHLPGQPCDNAGVVATELALTEVAADVFELRLPIPFEDGLVNVFLFPDGDEADLVDCGMNTDESVDAIHAAVRNVGAKRIRRLVVTHIHPDHYGAAGVFAGPGLADLYLHRLEVPLVYPRYVELEHLVSEVHTYLLVNGVPEDEAQVMSNSQRALSEIVKPAVPAVQLEGAETLEVGRRRLRVEWTPGHSPGHICLYDESDKLLLAGDHMLPELSPNIGLHPQSTPDPLHEYLEGLKRLAGYEPRLILPAHGRPFTDASKRVSALLAHHKRRLEQIAAIASHGERSAWAVALELWGPRDNPYEKRAALQEGLAHLQALAVEGRVKKFVTPTSVRWHG